MALFITVFKDQVKREVHSVEIPLKLTWVEEGDLPSVFRAVPQSSLVPFLICS